MTIPIQLAIQGGGAKVTYLVAALEAVQELERAGLLRVTRIAGTSSGAIAGALYAAGVDMRRAREAFEANREELLDAFPVPGNTWHALKLLMHRPIWNAAALRRFLAKLLHPRETLGDLDIPLTVVSSDLSNMQPCVYKNAQEPLLSAVMDSTGIPFFFRTARRSRDAYYRVVVDGGICENLPSQELAYTPELGEIVGITFGVSRKAAPLTNISAFAGALLETAMNASVLRSQMELGLNNFVIRTNAGCFDFPHAFEAGLGAEYRETKLLAEKFFRGYAERYVRLSSDAHVDAAPSGTAAASFPRSHVRRRADQLRRPRELLHPGLERGADPAGHGVRLQSIEEGDAMTSIRLEL